MRICGRARDFVFCFRLPATKAFTSGKIGVKSWSRKECVAWFQSCRITAVDELWKGKRSFSWDLFRIIALKPWFRTRTWSRWRHTWRRRWRCTITRAEVWSFLDVRLVGIIAFQRRSWRSCWRRIKKWGRVNVRWIWKLAFPLFAGGWVLTIGFKTRKKCPWPYFWRI